MTSLEKVIRSQDTCSSASVRAPWRWSKLTTVPWQPSRSMRPVPSWPALQRRWGAVVLCFSPLFLMHLPAFLKTLTSTGNRNQSLQRSWGTETLWIPPRDEKVSAGLVKRFGKSGWVSSGETGVYRLGGSGVFVTGSQPRPASCEGRLASASQASTKCTIEKENVWGFHCVA